MNKGAHIQLDDSIACTSAILPGDPARVNAIAAFLTDVKEEIFNREYKSITGTYKGTRILAISTGMGGPSTAICVEELADIGIRNIIRIGSCGALQSSLSLGQLVLCDRAVCDDGTSQTYLNYFRYASPEYPAPVYLPDKQTESVKSNASSGCSHADETAGSQICFSYADSDLLRACETAAQTLQTPYAIGPTRCHDALYLREKPQLDEFYSSKGIYASDMETASIFAVSALRGIRAASILNVVVEWKKDLAEGISSYHDGEDAAAKGEENEIRTALEALHLIEGR